VGIEYIVDLMK